MAWDGDLVTVTNTATRLSSTALDCTEVTIRALAANSASIFFGKSDVTTTDNYLVFLAPGEAFTWGPYAGNVPPIDLREIFYISANTSDKFALSYNKR